MGGSLSTVSKDRNGARIFVAYGEFIFTVPRVASQPLPTADPWRTPGPLVPVWPSLGAPLAQDKSVSPSGNRLKKQAAHTCVRRSA